MSGGSTDQDIEALLAQAQKPVAESIRLHPLYRGKMQSLPKCPIRDPADFAIWYTPGVAAPCKAIAAEPERVFDYTNRGNTIAIVTDGSRVLGLGDIGPEASLPVMEGKALLFKYLGGVDAVPICLATKDADDIVETTRRLVPSFGAINLEDIAQPKCFRILEALRADLSIPVWHDDQQGSGTVVLAGLLNALELVGKRLDRARIVMIGAGAAGVATYRLLTAAGADPGSIVVCDRKATLHRARRDIATDKDAFPEKWHICGATNAAGVSDGIAEALRGADVCIAFSSPGPGVIQADWVETMAKDAIVFACANPVPEIWPWEAKAAGASIVATGRSDFPNQVNNSLCFPGIFRGVLDVRARAITEAMAVAAARELAAAAQAGGLTENRILPTMNEWQVAARVAGATAEAARLEGVTGVERSRREVEEGALEKIANAREATAALMREGLIALPPPGGE